MSGTDPRSSGARLGRRSWTTAGAVLPVTGVAMLASCVVAAGLTSGPAQRLAVVAVLAVGILGGLLWQRAGGAEATHRRVASARAAWARSWSGARFDDDGPADPRDTTLALPRGWRAEAARGRLHLPVTGMPLRCETWVLRAVPGSRRSRVRREIVAADAHTGAACVYVPIGLTSDSMLVTPAWAGRPAMPEPAWLPAVRKRVARHDDLLGALTIGDDRVVLLMLDDPRPETTIARAHLVRDVAAAIG